MLDVEEFERWFRKAENELRDAETFSGQGRRRSGLAVHCASHAAQGALKALLLSLGVKLDCVRVTVWLSEVGSMGIKVGAEQEKWARWLDGLNHWFQRRAAHEDEGVYMDGGPFGLSADEAVQSALECARRLLEFAGKVFGDVKGA